MSKSATFWNGEPCAAKRVRVVVGKARSTWWCANLEGTVREAVRVEYGGSAFYLDNENGSGWYKVTIGRGSPQVGHSSLPDSSKEVCKDCEMHSDCCGQPCEKHAPIKECIGLDKVHVDGNCPLHAHGFVNEAKRAN